VMSCPSCPTTRGDLMMERIPGLPDNVLGFRASGSVSADDYANVVVPAVETASKANEKLRLLYVIPNDCTGFSVNSMWDDTKVVMGHVKQWEKIALVSDQEWLRDSVKLLGRLMPGELKGFPMQEEASAGVWVASS
jgi:SpoIIAA-like